MAAVPAKQTNPQPQPNTPQPNVSQQPAAAATETPADQVKGPYDGQTPAEVIKKFGGVSQAIRGLYAEGFSRSQIAKLTDKRYQHVRNVLITPVKNPGQRGNTGTGANKPVGMPANPPQNTAAGASQSA